MRSDNNRNKHFSHPLKQADFTLFYDGACPICRREVNWLKRLNKQQKLVFQDINAANFKPEQFQLSHAELMAEIHGQKASGELIKAMPVFREVYKAVGLGWLLAPTAWPLLKPVFDYLYQVFAKHRHKLGQLFSHKTACQRCIK